jgi:hypothetical protein
MSSLRYGNDFSLSVQGGSYMTIEQIDTTIKIAIQIVRTSNPAYSQVAANIKVLLIIDGILLF